MSEKLALHGGSKTIPHEFPVYNSYGEEEVKAAAEVVKSGVLSKFVGAWDPDFFGGPKVQAFERTWEKEFQVPHAVAVNSNTSGLICALGALGVEPGDEVIVSPWTMCASATSILIWNGIPVFADIEPETFCLDPQSILKKITPKTKGILVTDIFGQAARLDEIHEIAKKHGLWVIEDAAQVPGVKYEKGFVGTNSDIGVYSLNYHKHIHTGEGGMCVTRSAHLFERMQLIRNHAEAVVQDKGVKDLSNMIGFNFRLGEIEAAMGLEQLKKLPRLAQKRNEMGTRLTQGLSSLPGLKTPYAHPNRMHIYYIYGLTLDTKAVGVSREKIIEALNAEGVSNISGGYQNVHLFPIFQKKMAYGKNGFPWTTFNSSVSYEKGVCPTAEKLHDESFMNLYFCGHDYDEEKIDLTIKAFKKVWSNLAALK